MAKQSNKQGGLNFDRKLNQSFVIVDNEQVVGTITLTRIGRTRASFNIKGDQARVFRSELWAQMQQAKQPKETTDGPVIENQGLAPAL